jgi:hypothetical protein
LFFLANFLFNLYNLTFFSYYLVILANLFACDDYFASLYILLAILFPELLTIALISAPWLLVYTFSRAFYVLTSADLALVLIALRALLKSPYAF